LFPHFSQLACEKRSCAPSPQPFTKNQNSRSHLVQYQNFYSLFALFVMLIMIPSPLRRNIKSNILYTKHLYR
jgi:hypothetical protein